MKKCGSIATVVVLVCGLMTIGGGCAAIVVGAAAAGTVYVTGEDMAEVTFQKSWDAVFDASVDVCDRLGAIETRDAKAGTITADIDKASVELTLSHETEGRVKLTAKARKNSGVSPDSRTASKVTAEVAKKLGG